jgi:hypothetical protein
LQKWAIPGSEVTDLPSAVEQVFDRISSGFEIFFSIFW